MRKILLLLTTFLILAVGTSCSNSEILYSANTQTVEEICSDCDSDSMLVYHVYSDSLVTADGEVLFVQNYDCNHDSLTCSVYFVGFNTIEKWKRDTVVFYQDSTVVMHDLAGISSKKGISLKLDMDELRKFMLNVKDSSCQFDYPKNKDSAEYRIYGDNYYVDVKRPLLSLKVDGKGYDLGKNMKLKIYHKGTEKERVELVENEYSKNRYAYSFSYGPRKLYIDGDVVACLLSNFYFSDSWNSKLTGCNDVSVKTNSYSYGSDYIVCDGGDIYKVDYESATNSRWFVKNLVVDNGIFADSLFTWGQAMGVLGKRLDPQIIVLYKATAEGDSSEKDVNVDSLYSWADYSYASLETNAKGLCPVGWHVSSKFDWEKLREYYQGNDYYSLKFSGYPEGDYWTTEQESDSTAYYQEFTLSDTIPEIKIANKLRKKAIRCVEDK
ncbi:hypothetical protein J6W78_00215 [bacterium]|nr:hypothetical protein [bacterium]